MHRPSFQTKVEARAWARQLRDQMSPTARSMIAATAIQRLVDAQEFAQSETLLSYVGSKGSELDTRPLIEFALAAGKRVLVPITRPGGAMLWSRLHRLTELEFTPRGILEPRSEAIELVEPDGGLCVAPGAGFRTDGHRIGFGGGYYDRFLAHFQGNAVAIAPEALFGIEFPVEEHDRAVSVVFTEAATHLTSG